LLLLLYAAPWASLPSVRRVDDLKISPTHREDNEAREAKPSGLFLFQRRLRIALFPAFLKLHGRRVVVVGGGPVAASKLAALQAAGADIRVVAPEVCEDVVSAGVTIERRGFEPSDLDGAWFVVAAAPPEVNRQVGEEAARRQVFVNAVDDPDNATVYLGGVVRRDGVTLAISTDGSAPALAGLLREALDEVLPADLDAWTRVARELRPSWRAREVPMEARRPELLEALNALYDGRTGAGRPEEPVR
jgi:uroporphyrin-III C-methyltransferase/precorrin-2 dehydrogenase/sirohydrochlorin ferrochelatase